MRPRYRIVALFLLLIVTLAGVAYLSYDKQETTEKKAEVAKEKSAETREDVRTIERVIIRKGIAVRGKDGLRGAQGPVGKTGPRGPRGAQGPRGAPGRNGRSLTLADLAALCDIRECRGPEGPPGRDGTDGKDGAPAPPPTQEQVNVAVASWCATHPCVGPAGPQGEPGTPGEPGPTGPQGPPGPAPTVVTCQPAGGGTFTCTAAQ